MSNSIDSDNIIRRALDILKERIPSNWEIVHRNRPLSQSDYRPDAVIEIRAPDGTRAVVLVEGKPRLAASHALAMVPRITKAGREIGADGVLVVSRYLSDLTRARLREHGISYLDLTGNIRITLEGPAVWIETQGSDRDPAPPRRGVRSLKGAKAGRLVRVLCDWRPPVGVRQLARRAGADPGYATRVLSLLEDEDIIKRDETGVVTEVRWRDLLPRWAKDYDRGHTNRIVPFLAPRGLDKFLDHLSSFRERYALTGLLATPPAASVAPPRTARCFVDDPEGAAKVLDLRPADTGANVLLLQPFDPVVYERARTESNLILVALSQHVVDLLTGPGREPTAAESAMAWMEQHEDVWRR